MKPREHIPGSLSGNSRAMTIGILLILIGCIAVVVTTVFINKSHSTFLISQRDRFIASEVALFTILAVEISGRMIINSLTRRNALQAGITTRSVLRMICYLIMTVVILSVLADNPSLAIGVGTITGIIAGLAAQATLGNVLSGIVLTIRHPVTVGDIVTVSGITGRIIDITLLYTIMDSGESSVFIPNTAMMNSAVQRKKIVL
jgi:small-conductance mechanosensitive channel